MINNTCHVIDNNDTEKVEGWEQGIMLIRFDLFSDRDSILKTKTKGSGRKTCREYMGCIVDLWAHAHLITGCIISITSHDLQSTTIPWNTLY